MTESEIIPLVTGPASALGICLLIGLGVYRIVGNSLIPMFQRAIDRHLDSVDSMANAHNAEHMRIIETCERIERKVGGLYARVESVKDSA